ncbi:MAG: hypothetical protein J0J02_01275 [Thiobacillus sp.]|nr:hypothetical protein [Thiobacillus sp.]
MATIAVTMTADLTLDNMFHSMKSGQLPHGWNDAEVFEKREICRAMGGRAK